MNRATAKRKPRKAIYPFIGVRFSAPVDARLRAVAKATGEKISRLLQNMANKHLPELERECGIKN